MTAVDGPFCKPSRWWLPLTGRRPDLLLSSFDSVVELPRDVGSVGRIGSIGPDRFGQAELVVIAESRLVVVAESRRPGVRGVGAMPDRCADCPEGAACVGG